MNDNFNKEAPEYKAGYQEGLLAGYDLARQDFSRQPSVGALEPDDFCPKTTSVENILSIPCQNCLFEDECDFPEMKDEYPYDDFDDWDDELMYDTTRIEKFQAVIETLHCISADLSSVKCKYFQNKDLLDEVNSIHREISHIILNIRDLQEQSAVDEMYNFICRNY